MADQLPGLLEVLPGYLSAHVLLTVVALGIGLIISLPLGILLTRHKKLQLPMLSAAGVIQTVPSLALLALMVPVLELVRQTGVDVSSFGFLPAVIALTLYSILPVLRNTVAGIAQVDPALIEASRGVGMTDRQRLLRVELPLAAPVILAGVRTATVWVVGIATLATPIGQECLGNYIFTGLQTRNTWMILWGVAAAAGLALCMDLLIGAAQHAVARRSRVRIGLCSAAAALLLGFTLGWPYLPSVNVSSTDDPEVAQVNDLGAIRIGAKTFTEQYVLASLIERTLNDAGYETERFESLGSTVIFNQLAAGELDVYVDYSGTIWANQLKREGGGSSQLVLDETAWWLANEKGVRQLGALGFENAYALAMRRDRAEALGIESVDDLASQSDQLSIGGDYEFFGRPEWEGLRDAYGLNFTAQRTFDSSLMYEAVSRGEVDVIAAFSSDGRIAAFDLVVLDEPRNAIPPYDAVLLIGPRVADDPILIESLRPLLGAVSLPLMQQANEAVDVSKRPISDAAASLGEAIEED